MANFANQQLVANPNRDLGTFATRAALIGEEKAVELQMIGKLMGAWLGKKVAGRNEGARGAVTGYATAALAKRSIPTLAAVALGGWAFRKWRERNRSKRAYPSEATPSSS